MKRILSGITAVMLAFSIFGTVSHAKAMTMEQAEQEVEKTNAQINKDIDRAVEKANALVAKYQYALVENSKIHDSKEVKDNINEVVNALNTLSQSYSGTTEYKVTSDKIKGLNYNLESLRNEVTNTEFANVFYYDNNKLYEDFNQQLDKIIIQLIKETNQKAEKLRREAAKYGISIESEWIMVNIGGRNVLIDPARVLGL